MRKLSSAVFVGGLILVLAFAGCGGGGGGGGNNDNNNPPPPPGGSGSIVISGRVVSSANTGQGVQGVTVTLGSPGSGLDRTGVTNSTGNFSITVPSGLNTPLMMYPSIPYNFRVNTAGAGTSFPSTLPVVYNGISYDPFNGSASIPVPAAVLTATSSTSMGTITVTFYDPDNPPPPPF